MPSAIVIILLKVIIISLPSAIAIVLLIQNVNIVAPPSCSPPRSLSCYSNHYEKIQHEKIQNCLTGVPCTVALNFWDGGLGGRRCPGGRCRRMCPSGSRDPKQRAYPAEVDPRDGRVHGTDESSPTVGNSSRLVLGATATRGKPMRSSVPVVRGTGKCSHIACRHTRE